MRLKVVGHTVKTIKTGKERSSKVDFLVNSEHQVNKYTSQWQEQVVCYFYACCVIFFINVHKSVWLISFWYHVLRCFLLSFFLFTQRLHISLVLPLDCLLAGCLFFLICRDLLELWTESLCFFVVIVVYLCKALTIAAELVFYAFSLNQMNSTLSAAWLAGRGFSQCKVDNMFPNQCPFGQWRSTSLKKFSIMTMTIEVWNCLLGPMRFITRRNNSVL